VNPQDPLAQLHPLREPALIGWWPPAPGWWVLLALALLSLAGLAWALLRRYRAGAYRRRALRQLEAIRRDFQGGGSSAECVARTNALLKSVALRAYPRPEVAPASGRAWLDFLNHSAARKPEFEEAFLHAPYEVNAAIDHQRLHEAAAHWIQCHEVRR